MTGYVAPAATVHVREATRPAMPKPHEAAAAGPQRGSQEGKNGSRKIFPRRASSLAWRSPMVRGDRVAVLVA